MTTIIIIIAIIFICAVAAEAFSASGFMFGNDDNDSDDDDIIIPNANIPTQRAKPKENGEISWEVKTDNENKFNTHAPIDKRVKTILL